MLIRTYREFDLLAEGARVDDHGLRRLEARVLDSPVGPGAPVERRLSPDLADQLTDALEALDARELDLDGVIGLGQALADLLLPTDIRSRLIRSLDRLGPDEGLRVRLRLEPALADIPWEYLHLPQQRGQRDETGFLALDPRLSIVRDEPIDGPLSATRAAGDRRLVVVMASPQAPSLGTLDLAGERAYVEAALTDVPGVTAEFVEQATIADVSDALGEDHTDVFHFAGHGVEDTLVLDDGNGAAWRLPAAQLAVNLRSRGVQLALLGACDTGRRDGANPWSGVATRLLSAGIPAALAMQYRIADGNAIAFGQAFYRGLAAGLPVDQAVSAGRLAIFNRMTGGRQDAKRLRFWRDWGVPVLYLRPDAAVSLASVVEPGARAALAGDPRLNVDARIRRIGERGSFVGTDLGIVESGKLDVRIGAERVAGRLVGARVGDLRTDADVSLDLGDVDGEVVGLQAATVGRAPRRRPRGSSD